MTIVIAPWGCTKGVRILRRFKIGNKKHLLYGSCSVVSDTWCSAQCRRNCLTVSMRIGSPRWASAWITPLVHAVCFACCVCMKRTFRSKVELPLVRSCSDLHLLLSGQYQSQPWLLKDEDPIPQLGRRRRRARWGTHHDDSSCCTNARNNSLSLPLSPPGTLPHTAIPTHMRPVHEAKRSALHPSLFLRI